MLSTLYKEKKKSQSFLIKQQKKKVNHLVIQDIYMCLVVGVERQKKKAGGRSVGKLRQLMTQYGSSHILDGYLLYWNREGTGELA